MGIPNPDPPDAPLVGRLFGPVELDGELVEAAQDCDLVLALDPQNPITPSN